MTRANYNGKANNDGVDKNCCSTMKRKKQEDAMPRVVVEEGELEGCEADLVTGGTYYAFKGIPYAKPPVGDLRFKSPQPPDKWIGVRDAKVHGPVCPHLDWRTKTIQEGSEDCLYLNVYTKYLKPTGTPLPVMVWIHGGAFSSGSGNSDIFGPSFLVEQDVILVTLNYRLEVLGFLCLDTKEVPGNAGLKDQVAALKWVKRNISSFGGDPENITLFGQSAGAACVSYHLLSSMSKGLFHKAISQSGICTSDWSYIKNPRKHALCLGKVLGKNTDDSEDLLSFLQDVPVSKLVNISLPLTLEENIECAFIYFGPVIEKDFENNDNFISLDPLTKLQTSDIPRVPMIVGYTTGEGIEVARGIAIGNESRNKNSSWILPREIKLDSIDENEKIGTKIKTFYFKDKEISMETIQEYVDLATDLYFVNGINRFASCYSERSDSALYMYRFSYEGDMNYVKSLYGMTQTKGVCHGDDLPYIFNMSIPQIKFSKESPDYGVVKQITKLWSNFAKTSNPTPDSDHGITWQHYTDLERNFIDIGEEVKPDVNPDEQRQGFWRQLFKEHTRSDQLNHRGSS